MTSVGGGPVAGHSGERETPVIPALGQPGSSPTELFGGESKPRKHRNQRHHASGVKGEATRFQARRDARPPFDGVSLLPTDLLNRIGHGIDRYNRILNQAWENSEEADTVPSLPWLMVLMLFGVALIVVLGLVIGARG